MTTPVTVAVVGRYRGAVDLLAQLLDPLDGVRRAGLDTDGDAAVVRAIEAVAATGVVVVTATPADPSLDLVTDRVPAARVVAVAWHPLDEGPEVPAGAAVLRAGSVTSGLLPTVRARLDS